MTSEELVNVLENEISSSEDRTPDGPLVGAYNNLFAGFLLASQQQYASISHASRDFILSRMHAPEKAGIMRTAGLTDEEYEVASQDPMMMNRIRADYFSTI